MFLRGMGHRRMTLENLVNVSSRLETGFLANRTIKVLKETHKITEKDEFIINKCLNFINAIKQGQEQANTGRLGDNSVIAADAYSSTLTALLCIDDKLANEFEELIQNIENQLKDVLEKKKVTKTKVKDTRMFFEAMLHYSAQESSRKFYEKVEENEWLNLLY